MSLKDLHNNIQVLRAISPIVVTDDTAQVSQIIDRQGAEALEFVLALGTLSDSNCTTTVLVEDGDDAALSDAAAVADEFLLGTEALAAPTFADDNEMRKIGYIGPKRYVRVTITPSGNTSNIPMSLIAIKAGHRVLPRSSQEA